MTETTNSKKDHDLDLESAICELAHIAAISRFYVSEGSEADDRIVTVVSHVAYMAEAVREAFYAKSNSNPAALAEK
jgi:hypothetical protein